MEQDPILQLLDRRRWVDPRFFTEHPSQALTCPQRLGPSTHRYRVSINWPQRRSQGVFNDQCRQWTHHPVMLSEVESCLHQILAPELLS